MESLIYFLYLLFRLWNICGWFIACNDLERSFMKLGPLQIAWIINKFHNRLQGSSQQRFNNQSSVLNMQIKKHIPYLLLIAANLIYLLIHGISPLKQSPKLFIYNFIIFLLVGIVVFFKVSYHLYQWFVVGQGDTREKTRIKVQQFLRFIAGIESYFKPGNVHNLIFIYVVLTLWTLLAYFIPKFLLGTVTGLIYELKQFLYDKYPKQVQQFWRRADKIVHVIQQSLPKYKKEAISTENE